MKIAFFDSKPYDKDSFERVNKDFGFELEFFEPKLTAKTCFMASGFEAVCVFVNDTVDESVINKLTELGVKLIVLRCAGYNNVDFKAAYGKIHVMRVPAYSPYAVAEHAAALLMTLNRKIHRAYLRTRDGNFSLSGLLGFDLHGKTAGIIGTGKIAKCLISILLGFGVKILAYDPYPDNDYAEKTGIQYTTLDELYNGSDIISLHCPLTKENVHMIDADAIGKMKKGVFIINTGRGKLIDSVALIGGLKSRKIGGACLDVYEEESRYFYEDKSGKVMDDDVLARLLSFPNVLITSHQAFFTKEALHNIAETTLNNIKEFEEGGPLTNEVCYQCLSAGKNCPKKEGKRCF